MRMSLSQTSMHKHTYCHPLAGGRKENTLATNARPRFAAHLKRLPDFVHYCRNMFLSTNNGDDGKQLSTSKCDTLVAPGVTYKQRTRMRTLWGAESTATLPSKRITSYIIRDSAFRLWQSQFLLGWCSVTVRNHLWHSSTLYWYMFLTS